MRAYLMLFIATSALIGAVYGNCNSCFTEQCYERRLVPNISGTSGDIYRKENTLYVTEPDQIKRCRLDGANCIKYKAQDIRKVVVDQLTGDVYGSTYLNKKAIYKFDIDNNVKSVVVPNVNALDIQFQRKLYYANVNGGIYRLENGKSQLIPGTRPYRITSFVVDRNSDIYFVSSKHGESITRRLSKGKVDDSFFVKVTSLSLDKDGNVMFINQSNPVTPNGLNAKIYTVKKHKLVEVGIIDEWKNSTLLFDRYNNLVYAWSSGKSYYNLKKKSGLKCKVENNKIKILEPTLSSTITYPTETETASSPYEATNDDVTEIFSSTITYPTETETASSPYEVTNEDVTEIFSSTITYPTETETASSPYEATNEDVTEIFSSTITYPTETETASSPYEATNEDVTEIFSSTIIYPTEPETASSPYETNNEDVTKIFSSIITYPTESETTSSPYETNNEDVTKIFSSTITYPTAPEITRSPYETSSEDPSQIFSRTITYTLVPKTGNSLYETGSDDVSKIFSSEITCTTTPEKHNSPYETCSEDVSKVFSSKITYTNESTRTSSPSGNEESKYEENENQNCTCEQLPDMNIIIEFD